MDTDLVCMALALIAVSAYTIFLAIRADIIDTKVYHLEESLKRASTYQGFEAWPCPLCTYKDGIFIEHCSCIDIDFVSETFFENVFICVKFLIMQKPKSQIIVSP